MAVLIGLSSASGGAFAEMLSTSPSQWLEKKAIFARTHARYVAGRLLGDDQGFDDLNWILMATLPNSGSTAFAGIISSSPDVTMATSSGEGQWLVPDLEAPGRRWDPGTPVNFDRVRYVWSRNARRRNPDAGYAFDKSPPSLVRLAALQRALGGPERVSIISFCRDPLAICASWIKRYPPDVFARTWGGLSNNQMSGPAFWRRVGEICGERMELLARARETSVLHIAYEDFCANPIGTVEKLYAAFPGLRQMDPGKQVAVKDYDPQAIRNMNCEQLGMLTETQNAALCEGLSKHRHTIESFGYSIGDPEA